MHDSPFKAVTEQLKAKVAGFRALVLVNLDGLITEQSVDDPGVDHDALVEYATLARIARRTSQDARAGELIEIQWTSERACVLARRVFGDSFLILVSDPSGSAGLARYALRRAAREMAPGSS